MTQNLSKPSKYIHWGMFSHFFDYFFIFLIFGQKSLKNHCLSKIRYKIASVAPSLRNSTEQNIMIQEVVKIVV